jgi:hypothetical protein
MSDYLDSDSYGHHCPNCNQRVVTVWVTVPEKPDNGCFGAVLVIGAVIVAVGLGFGVEFVWYIGAGLIAWAIGGFFSNPTKRVRQCPICSHVCTEVAATNPVT